MAIYTGNGQDIFINEYNQGVDIFPTSTWAETLPAELRTFRFDVYVSNGSSTSANIRGPYGLLNEFSAYCWGMNDQLALFPYYKSQGNTMKVWREFVEACGNDRQAYAEFRFYILGYLDYARKNNNAVYKLFISDQEFCKAYVAIKNRFESQIKAFDARCEEIVSLAAADGIWAYFDGEYFWFGNSGTSTNYTEYSILMNEVSKSKYQDIEAALYARSTGEESEYYGFVNKNGSWGWYEDGQLQTSLTGIILGTINGIEAVYYIRNGIFTKATGITQRINSDDDGWYYVQDGVYTAATCTAQKIDGSDKNWYNVLYGAAEINHIHNMVKTNAKEATCTEPGNKEYWTCSECNKSFSDNVGQNEINVKDYQIAALGHRSVSVPSIAATCTKTGLTEGSRCSVCGNVIKAQETIPATGHNYVNGICVNCGDTQAQSGFVKVNNTWGWYRNGKLQTAMTGIVQGSIDGKENWYYIEKGIFSKTTGFAQLADGSNNKWYFVSDGEIKTGWVKYNNKYYYFRPSTGILRTGWVKSGGKYYYLNPSTGALKTGWLKYKGSYYYLSPKTGNPVTGKQKIGGKTYTFNAYGVCIG